MCGDTITCTFNESLWHVYIWRRVSMHPREALKTRANDDPTPRRESLLRFSLVRKSQRDPINAQSRKKFRLPERNCVGTFDLYAPGPPINAEITLARKTTPDDSQNTLPSVSPTGTLPLREKKTLSLSSRFFESSFEIPFVSREKRRKKNNAI